MKQFLIFACVFSLFFFACASGPRYLPGQDTFYVKAGGSDRNDGLSPETPFRSLFKALAAAAKGTIKTITVLGTLDEASEQSSNRERVFLIQSMGKNEILIRGTPSAGEPAVLSAAGSGRRAVLIRGNSPIRFEHIVISGGVSSGEGGGIGIAPGCTVILGPGAVIRDNKSDNIGGGIAVFRGGTCTLSGGTIYGNTAGLAGGGVVVIQSGTFIMEEGVVRENKTSGSGGGFALLGGGALVFKNGEINSNSAGEHGGGIAADTESAITVEGGFISANTAAIWGGGVFTAGPFQKTGGKIYGNDVPKDQANTAVLGPAVFIYQWDRTYKVREKSAGEDLILDASADDGWDIEEDEENEEDEE
ncbi:MAG: hypothetical protein LBB72_09315 [Spirochaetaceae bacterium]|jgi:hypothetical protein|nr:hypothetical protein [Spirochaetaceae bacterium]